MKTISFKVSETEEETIRHQAKMEGLTVSEFLRRRAVDPFSAGGIARAVCEFTGAEIFAPANSTSPLTVAATREILADFP